MGNRISNSERFFVKVQRIYVSWCEIMVLISQLRCFLKGLERDYQIKALSNQIKFFRPYYTYSSPQPKIKIQIILYFKISFRS